MVTPSLKLDQLYTSGGVGWDFGTQEPKDFREFILQR
jgi:hypothetical protein